VRAILRVTVPASREPEINRDDIQMSDNVVARRRPVLPLAPQYETFEALLPPLRAGDRARHAESGLAANDPISGVGTASRVS